MLEPLQKAYKQAPRLQVAGLISLQSTDIVLTWLVGNRDVTDDVIRADPENQWRHSGWCHPGRQLMVSPYFYLKNWRPFLVIASESDDLFSCHVLTTPIFRRFSSVLSKFSRKKNNFIQMSLLDGVTRGGPPLVTPLLRIQRWYLIGPYLTFPISVCWATFRTLYRHSSLDISQSSVATHLRCGGIIALLQIVSWFWQWNNFENRLTFLGHSVCILRYSLLARICLSVPVTLVIHA